jgi:ribonuclease HI
MSAEYLCYTDGSVKAGEGGPGGWGFHIRPPEGAPLEGWGKARDALAKVMEYQAVAEALAVLPEGAVAVVFSDNQSLVENLSKHLGHWGANGFSKVDPAIVAQVRRAHETIAARRLTLRWQWLRSHNGNDGNERADELAARGAREMKAELAAEAKLERKKR